MGNKAQKESQIASIKPREKQSFAEIHEDNFIKIIIDNVKSTLYGCGIEMIEHPRSNDIIISAMKSRLIRICEFTAKEIDSYASDKKRTLMKLRREFSSSVPIKKYFGTKAITCMTFNTKKEHSLFCAHKNLLNYCTVPKRKWNGTMDTPAIHEVWIAKDQETISCFKLINDDSNRIIFGTDDGWICVYDYVNRVCVAGIDCNKTDHVDNKAEVMACDYFIDESLNLLVIALSNINGNVYVISIRNDKNKVVNKQFIEIGWGKLQTIGFSPDHDHRYIACAGEGFESFILERARNNPRWGPGQQEKNDNVKSRRNRKRKEKKKSKEKPLKNGKNGIEYGMYMNENIFGECADGHRTLICCAWLSDKTVVFGGDNGVFKALDILGMKGNKDYIEVVAPSVDNVDLLAELILDFCGAFNKFAIEIPFEYKIRLSDGVYERILDLKTLPVSKCCPGLMLVSFPTSLCLFVPRKTNSI